MSTMTGEDVSKWQGEIDWSEAKTQTGFAMVKATQGINEVDPDYAANIAALRTAGEHRGSYHYPDAGDPVAEADFYVLHAGRHNGEMQALDFEGAVLHVTDPVGWAQRFLSRVIDRTDNVPLIYMSESTEGAFDWSRVIALDVGLWCAAWQAVKPRPGHWPFVIMWQRSDDGRLAGIDGNVDQDVFYGDSAVWARYANNRTSKPPATPPPAPARPLPKPTPTAPAPKRTPAHTDGAAVHVVVSGDNLTKIGQAAGVSVAELVALNKDRYPSLGWNRSLIQPGWRLITHEAGTAHLPVYTVQSGDSLSAIASEHHTSVAELVTLNESRYSTLRTDPDLIQPGWKLTLP